MDTTSGNAGGGSMTGILPHFTIQAFCETSDVQSSLEAAFSDRHMSRVEGQTHMGGLDAAVPYFSERRTPDILVIESSASREALMPILGRLAEVCDERTRVIIIGAVNDVRLYQDLVREGVSEYIVSPIDPMHFIGLLGNLYADPSSAPSGRSIAFIGGKGGVGSSTLSHNVAWMLATQFDQKVILLDMDLNFGSSGLNYNVDGSNGMQDLFAAPDRVDESIIERLFSNIGNNLRLLSSPSSSDWSLSYNLDAIDRSMDILSHSATWVVIDLPFAWNAWTQRILRNVDDIGLVAIPNLVCLRNVKNMLESLSLLRPNDSKPHLLLNQCGMIKGKEISPSDFGQGVGSGSVISVDFDSNSFADSANDGKIVSERFPSSPAVLQLKDFVGSLTGGTVSEEKEKRLGDWSLKSVLNALGRK